MTLQIPIRKETERTDLTVSQMNTSNNNPDFMLVHDEDDAVHRYIQVGLSADSIKIYVVRTLAIFELT